MQLYRTALRMLRVLAGCMAVTSCGDSNGPEPIRGGLPIGSIYQTWQFIGQFDEVSVTITREDGDVAFDTVLVDVPSPTSQEATIPVRVGSVDSGEELDVHLVLRAGGVEWYESHSTATLVSGTLAFAPLVLSYTGPIVDSLSATLDPEVVVAGDSARVVVTAYRNGEVVPNVPLTFPFTDDRITTVRSGMMAAVVRTDTAAEGSFPIVAWMPNGVTGVGYLQVQGPPALRLFASFNKLGVRLQTQIQLYANRTNLDGLQVTIRSSRPGILFSRSDSTVGSTELVLTPSQFADRSFWVQAQGGAPGDLVISATGDAFATGVLSLPVVTAGVELTVPTELERNLALLEIRPTIGIPDSTGKSLSYNQALAPGGPPLTVQVESDAPEHLRVIDAVSGPDGATSGTGTILPGNNGTPWYPHPGGLALRTIDDGIAHVTVSIPGFTTVQNGRKSIAVAAPKPIVTQHDTLVGAGLSGGYYLLPSRNSAAAGTLTITSLDPTRLGITDVSGAPVTSRTLTFPGAGNNHSVQAVPGTSGTVSVVLSSSEFGSDTLEFTIVPPVIFFQDFPANIQIVGVESYPSPVVGISPQPGVYTRQLRGFGTPVPVTLTSSSAPVVGLIDSHGVLGSTVTKDLAGGRTYTTFRARTVGRGPVTLHVSAPGFGQVPASTLNVTIP